MLLNKSEDLRNTMRLAVIDSQVDFVKQLHSDYDFCNFIAEVGEARRLHVLYLTSVPPMLPTNIQLTGTLWK